MIGDDIQDYKRLYADGFPEDNAETADYYFDNIFNINKAYINDSKTACLHIVDKYIRIAGKEIVLPYIVSASTLTSHRGKGEMSALLRGVIRDYADKGLPFLALYPIDKNYYLKYAFVSVCGCSGDSTLYEDETVVNPKRLSSAQRENLANYMLKCYNSISGQYGAYQVLTIDDMYKRLDVISMEEDNGIACFKYPSNGQGCGYRIIGDETIAETVANIRFGKTDSDGAAIQLRACNIEACINILYNDIGADVWGYDNIVRYLDNIVGDKAFYLDHNNRLHYINYNGEKAKYTIDPKSLIDVIFDNDCVDCRIGAVNYNKQILLLDKF